MIKTSKGRWLSDGVAILIITVSECLKVGGWFMIVDILVCIIELYNSRFQSLHAVTYINCLTLL